MNCSACHTDGNANGSAKTAWIAKPDDRRCKGCHAQQKGEFEQGRHGMRLAMGLPPMQPRMARLPMRREAADHELGCTSCHSAHRVDRIAAAKDACLGCHADRHSLAFDDSPHGRLWTEVKQGMRPANEAVSCATCHMPVVEFRISDLDMAHHHVQHNQNATLRPSDKMQRPACLNCHGLEFAADALADAALVARNFGGRPAVKVTSTGVAVQRDEQIRQQRAAAAAETPP